MSIQYILYIFFILSIFYQKVKGAKAKVKSARCKSTSTVLYGYTVLCARQSYQAICNTLYFPATLRAKPAVCHQAPSPARERRT